ncbi:hypothetical protein [Lentisalinibacter orientalis]|uniref:hypothetical protein n=1 Tax=Lentisalinibacter orientalis TaxID=2992241 RepID=UPI00386593B2
MKTTHSKTLVCLTAMVLSASLPGVANAQQEQFPREREQTKSCAEVDWNPEMLRNHPRLIEACREVVIASGENWARFEAKFVRVEPDGKVTFSIRDRRDRSIEAVTLQPAMNQVAYIDNRATPFARLRRDQLVNLYVPEGTYGFVTQPGAPPEQIAEVATPVTPPAATRVAATQTRAEMLPATASPLPWLALGGFLSLLGALAVRTGRRT